MSSSRTTTSSTAELTNGYHTPSSPQSFSDEHHHPETLASRQEYARILYDHTMKQMERFALEAQSRGTLAMDFHTQGVTASH
ncbi:hypothetical protein ABW21_db0205617 [Orbilia brochopaga]|nr:hypothetical protein ABW21_db0205617 [Drechslerella brochopaga]